MKVLTNHISIKQASKTLWEIESKKKLIDLNISGVKIWQLSRYQVFNLLLKELGIFGQAHTEKHSLSDKLKVIPSIFVNSIFKNPFLSKEIDILIFDHPRKINVEDKYVDIYTENLIKEMNLKNINYEVIEMDYLRKHWSDRRDNKRSYYDFYYIKSLNGRLKNKITLTPLEEQIIEEIEKDIQLQFNVSLPLIQLFKKLIKDFKLQYRFYTDLLKYKNPQEIYVVVSYGYQSLIAAAKNQNIKVIEIQHGVITPYHLGYSFPNSRKIDYYPDEIYLFGDFWKKSTYFPLPENKLIPYGFPFLTKQLNRYKKNIKKKQIIFLSQGTIGKRLSEFAEKLASKTNYNIIYKLHPGEFDRWKAVYPALNRAKKYNNFQIVDHSNIELYELLSSSEIQIGVYSTAIFEGITLGCKTVLVNLPGIEYMENLIKHKLVTVIDNDEELIKNFDRLKIPDIQQGYLFKDAY